MLYVRLCRVLLAALYGRTSTTTPSFDRSTDSSSLASTTLTSVRLLPSPSHTLTLGSANHPEPPTAIMSMFISLFAPGGISGICTDRLPCHTNASAVSTWTDSPMAESVGWELRS